jgi:hypothetical protein
MRKAVIALAAFAALATSSQARANEAAHEAAEGGEKFKLGVGTGYSFAFGDASKSAAGTTAMSDLYAGEVPVELEASYKLTHAISAGVYAGYGYGMPSSTVSDTVSSFTTWRFGVQGEYEFAKLGPALPFAGLRVGYFTESSNTKNGAESGSASGWEYLTVFGGAEFEVAKGFAVGPFASLAIGEYTYEKKGSEGGSIPSGDRTLHQWLTIGVRGSWGL